MQDRADPAPSPAAPTWPVYAALAVLAGPFLLCAANRRRGALVDLYIAPWAASLYATLALAAGVLAAAFVLWLHLRRVRAGSGRHHPLRILWDCGLAAALAWALMLASVPAFLALPGLPDRQIAAQVHARPLPATRACSHPFALAPAPASILSVARVCAASADEAARIAAHGSPTVPVVLTGWGNPTALIFPTARLAAPGNGA